MYGLSELVFGSFSSGESKFTYAAARLTRAWVWRLALAVPILLAGCASLGRTPPSTPGDPSRAKSYGYQPIDPLPVDILLRKPPAPPRYPAKDLLAAMSDETVRIAVGQLEGNAAVTFGPATTGVEGKSYVVIIDYIKYQTQSIQSVATGTGSFRPAVSAADTGAATGPLVPVYIGVGLRLTASVTVLKGKVDLGNLFALGVAAQANRVAGTMVVQTLGISGPTISGIIPMPSEINPTTIQNSILALGTIKAKLYDEGTGITPRVVGVYNTVGGGEATINSFISTLLQRRLFFDVPPS